jgi:transposase
LAEKEKEYVLEVLTAAGDNVSRAAEILNIDRRTLYRILERHGIERGNESSARFPTPALLSGEPPRPGAARVGVTL